MTQSSLSGIGSKPTFIERALQMNSKKVHDWLQIAGVLGVVAGLALVAYELRQNHSMMQAQTRQALAQSAIDLLWREGEDQDLANIIVRGNAGEELSADEFFRFRRTNTAFFVYWENVYYQYKTGLIDDLEFEPQKGVWRSRMANPGIRKVWCLHRHTVSPEVVAEVESMMSEKCSLDETIDR